MVVYKKYFVKILITLCISIDIYSSTWTKISRFIAEDADNSTIHYGPQITGDEPRTIYSHGLLCNKWVGGLVHCDNLIRSPNAFIKGPMISFHYRDWLSPLSTCVAQEDDLEQLHGICQKHTNVILVGCSRGAGAIINYLGMQKPNNVIGAVIESPFDDTRNVINYLAKQMNIHKKSTIDAISTKLAPNHKQDGIQPKDHVANICHEIPLLFICTTKDRIIPFESCIELYKASSKAGHSRAHLLIAQHGAHGQIINSTDGSMMRNVIHAFYQKYDLPHDPEWAREGAMRFAECQPTVEILEKMYPPKETRIYN